MQDNTIYLPEHPVWGTALAVLNDEPVWPQRGAADDDDNEPEIDLENPSGGTGSGGRDILDDEPDEDEHDGDGPLAEENTDEGEAAKKPAAKKPEQKPGRTDADWEKLQKALESERGLRRKRDATLAEYRKKEREAQAQGDDETAEQVRKATEAAEARYKPIAIHAAAKAALLERNFQRPTEERIKKMVKRLDLDDIEIDSDGDVIGLDAQIEQLAEDFPELFTTPAAPAPAPEPRKTPRVTTSNKPPVEQQPKTTAERIAAKITSGQS